MPILEIYQFYVRVILFYPILSTVNKLKITLSLLVVISLCKSLFSQTTEAGVDSSRYNNSIIPIAFYLPETGLAFGATGILSFHMKGEDLETRPSQILYSAAYTLKNQLLIFLPYEIYTDEERNRYKGELGYYRYFYNFYGVGPDARLDDQEIYSVNFPRVYFQYLRRVIGQHHIGLGFKYDDFDLYETEVGGIIDSQNLIGSGGDNTWMTSVNYVYDDRDNIFYPTKGLLLDVNVDLSNDNFLSKYEFTRWTADVRQYKELGRDDWVLASHLFASTASSGIPFYYLPYISSNLLSRGFADRRFMDYNLVNLQTEFRFPIRGRFYGNTFVSAANIGDQFNSNTIKWSGGLGLRYELDKKVRTRIRLDVGFTKEGFNFYITANEAY